jgi:hypothetical protein
LLGWTRGAAGDQVRRRDDAAPRGEERQREAPRGGGVAEAVQQHERIGAAGAGIEQVDGGAVDDDLRSERDRASVVARRLRQPSEPSTST